MWTPFRGSLSAKSDDVKTSRKLLVSNNHWFFPTNTFHPHSLLISFVLKIFLLAFLTFFILSAFLEQEINRSLTPHMRGPLPPPCPTPLAPQPRELNAIEEESERLARELKEVRDCADKSKKIHCCLISELPKEDECTDLTDFFLFFYFFYLCLCPTRCPGTETASGLRWPSSVSTEEFWPEHTVSRPHRCLKLDFCYNSCIIRYLLFD